MKRPITLYTGQWADMPLKELVRKAQEWGLDGLELACAGDHFEVDKALDSDRYLKDKRDLLEQHGLKCWALTQHLVGQCVCDDPIDERHQRIVPARVWGDGNPEGVRQRATEEVKRTGQAAGAFGVNMVVGFTGSKIWLTVAGFPPVPPEMIEAGYRDFADRWNPILDVFDQVGVRWASEVHPAEIAYDFWTTRRVLEALNYRKAFGLNMDPSHLYWQMVDPIGFIYEYRDSIVYVHVKDALRVLDGRNGILSSHLPFGNHQRGWDFVSPGRGEVPFERIFRALNDVGYAGPLSIEWEDNGMDRLQGVPEAVAMIKRLELTPSTVKFEAAYESKA
jgi:sugar phosphate isomerase/epimerase